MPEALDGAALDARAQALVDRAGGGKIAALRRIEGGRNNRAYRVDTAEHSYFLKVYHRDPEDPRPRLRTEVDFLELVWKAGIDCVPQPLAADENAAVALFAYVGGSKLTAGAIDRRHIEAAVRFIAALDRCRDRAATLPAASEACFSFAAHLDLVDRRVQRLRTIESDAAVRGFVDDELRPTWTELSAHLRAAAAEARLLEEGELSGAARCLSPSDFGFHNVLVDTSGKLIFHDFEYAGWDDPAKMVCDFLTQPEVPIPPELADSAAEQLLLAVGASAHRQRVRLLLPVYRVKWACICLNDFLPAGARRRRFAAAAGEAEQLRKARALLERGKAK